MAVISQDDYREIAVAYGNARTQVLGAKQFLFDAVYTIVLLDQVQPEVDLLSVFWDTYSINLDTLQAPTLLLSAVRSINQHVLREGGFADIDTYLEDGAGILVPQTWADLCDAGGFPIAAGNIE